ncbi:unnamed protein product [Sphagnum balticum]|jgi:hypothetical protein
MTRIAIDDLDLVFINIKLAVLFMGGTNQKQEQQALVPNAGYRVLLATTPELQARLNLLTDYVIAPDIRSVDLSQPAIEVSIFSILDYSIRRETLPIISQQIGVKLKHTQIRDCILRITKVFPNSPCEKLAILQNEYIVGLLEGDFLNLKEFAEVLRRLIS